MTRRYAALAIVALLTGTWAAFAHEGHAHKVMGTIAAIHENQLEVKDKDGKLSAHTLNPKTKILRRKAAAKLGDAKVGERVVVTFLESKDKAGKVVKTVTQVDLGTATATPTSTAKK